MAPVTVKLVALTASLILTGAQAQYGGFGGNYGGGGGGGGSSSSSNNGDGDGDGDYGSGYSSNPSSGAFNQGSIFSSEAAFSRATRILIAHAVLAALVWVLMIPSFAILLRLNMKNPVVLKIHAVGQIFSYVVFIAAAGMGVWLANQSAEFGAWSDPHPRLGLAILAIAFFEPLFGAAHHRLFKQRTAKAQAGEATKPPGRTAVGRVHLWVGRTLVPLGMINGGLGIRLAARSPFQTEATSRKVKIAYSVVAAAMFALYAIFVLAFEIRRKRQRAEELRARDKEVMAQKGTTLPTYDESEESLERNPRHQ